jgi:hypothetical protein
MTQSLWYLRHDGRTIGPFPSPQIKELLHAGEVSPDWEISLDQVDWMSLHESEQFQAGRQDAKQASDPERQSWHNEREVARQRWLEGEGKIEQALPHSKLRDDQTRKAIDADHERTQTLVKAQMRRGPPLWGALLVLVLLLGLGYAIWFGQQGEQPMQAAIQRAVNCEASLAERVNWAGCDKRGLDFSGGKARNGMLKGVRLDNSSLAGADLSYAVLQGASLRNVDLQAAKLTGADLSGADLTGANLSEASLDFALLKGANLEGTRLQGARLGRTEWVDGHQCSEVSISECR